jgi:hypothetical protein
MKSLSSLWKRVILRRAEASLTGPAGESELRQQGITIGEEQTFSGPEFLRLLAESDEPKTSSVTITVYLSDSPGAERYAFEDSLSDLLDAKGLGEWVGGGDGSLGGDDFFDITYTVTTIAAAVPVIQQHLESLGAGPRTRLSTSDGGELGLR